MTCLVFCPGGNQIRQQVYSLILHGHPLVYSKHIGHIIFFPARNFHFDRSRKSFSGSLKVEKKVLSCFRSFFPLHFSFSSFTSSFFPIFPHFPTSFFHIFLYIFHFLYFFLPFFLAPFFPISRQKFPGRKCLGALCPPAPTPLLPRLLRH